MKTKKIFVSYSRKDASIVRPITTLLRACGARVFRDEDNIAPGKRWRIVIEESLWDADTVIVFWSKNSAKSAQVKSEYEHAIKVDKEVIPVLLDQSPLTRSLKEFHYIRFPDRDDCLMSNLIDFHLPSSVGLAIKILNYLDSPLLHLCSRKRFRVASLAFKILQEKYSMVSLPQLVGIVSGTEEYEVYFQLSETENDEIVVRVDPFAWTGEIG